MVDEKYLIMWFEEYNEREWELLPEKIKALITKFVDTAMHNNMKTKDIIKCLQFMPSTCAERVIARFPEKEWGDLDSGLCRFYAMQFLLRTQKGKELNLPTVSEYNLMRKKGKHIRFICRGELFMILSGLNIEPEGLMFDLDEYSDDKNFKKLKQLYKERNTTKYRDAEYRMIKKYYEEFLNESLNLQQALISQTGQIVD